MATYEEWKKAADRVSNECPRIQTDEPSGGFEAFANTYGIRVMVSGSMMVLDLNPKQCVKLRDYLNELFPVEDGKPDRSGGDN